MGIVAVLGATGRTGGATVRHLVARGASVRALLRRTDGTPAERLRAAGVTVVGADMEDLASLRPALEGCDRLFNVQPAFDARGRHEADRERLQGRNVAQAVADAGVRHVVQLSAGPGTPTGLPHFDVKLEVREAFESKGLVVTALHPSPFMELMTDRGFAPALSTWGVEPRVVGWDRKIPWISVDDVGRAAAASLTDPVPEQSVTRVLVADHQTLAECRALLRARGIPVRRLPLPIWLFRKMVGDELLGMWEWLRTEPPLPKSNDGFATVPAWVDSLPA